MEGKNTNKSNIILIVLGCIIGAIILSFGVKTMINYSSGNEYNEERPYGATFDGSCSVGYFFVVTGGNASCEACPAGTTSSGGTATSCSSCPSGSFCTGGSAAQTCPSGSYSTGRASSCTYCQPGTYQDETGQTSCKTCPTGATSPTGSDEESDCVAVAATKITISGSSSVVVGESTKLSATITPLTASQNVLWSSGDPTVATIDSSGNVTAKKVGTTTITAAAKSDINIKDTLEITVKSASISISGNTSVIVGNSITLTATVLPPTMTQAVTWSSSDSTIATVENGVVKGLKAGLVIITARSVSSSTLVAEHKVFVNEATATLTCTPNIIWSKVDGVDLGDKATSSQCVMKIDDEIVDTPNTIRLNENGEDLANVTPKGVVTSKDNKSGVVTITASYNGKSASANVTIYSQVQTSPCSVGYFMSNTTCEKCTAGYYCSDGVKRTDCPDGKTSNIGAETELDCYTLNEQNNCSVTASITAKHVSVTSDGITANSYYEVTATVSGNGCKGKILTYTATNSKKVEPLRAEVTDKTKYTFKVYPAEACQSSTATATLDNGNSSTVTLDKNQVFNDWIIEKGCWSQTKVSGKPIGSAAADAAGADEYYDSYAWVWDDDGINACYTTHAYREWCGKSAEDESEDLPEEHSNGACYKNSDGHYVWSSSVPAGYTLASNVSRDECEGNSSGTYACYKNDSNHYVWAVTAPSGYTIVDGANEDNCKKPPEPACYKNSQNDYQWTSTPASGYTKVPSIIEEQYCDVNDNSACFSDNFGNYVWGDYNDNTSYTKITDIKSPEKCNRPAACYMNSNNEFVWGQYSNNSSYIIVDGIDNSEDCNNLVNVPPTAANVFNIVYISVAVMALFGGAVVYYVYRKKRLN